MIGFTKKKKKESMKISDDDLTVYFVLEPFTSSNLPSSVCFLRLKPQTCILVCTALAPAMLIPSCNSKPVIVTIEDFRAY